MPEEPEQEGAQSSIQTETLREASPGRGRLEMPRPVAKRPPPSARCPGCGHAELSSVPTFSAGSGVANRPFSEDVYCHRCGFIGMPALVGG